MNALPFYIILSVFVILLAKKCFVRPAKKVIKDDDDGADNIDDLSFSARREPSFDDIVQANTAVVKQSKKKTDSPTAPEVAPRGATRVRPKDIDYSVYETPTFLRRGISLSF